MTLFPRKRTSLSAIAMSALCQKQTSFGSASTYWPRRGASEQSTAAAAPIFEPAVHDEKESPEQLATEAEVSRQMADLLTRHDAGSLNALIKRHTK